MSSEWERAARVSWGSAHRGSSPWCSRASLCSSRARSSSGSSCMLSPPQASTVSVSPVPLLRVGSRASSSAAGSSPSTCRAPVVSASDPCCCTCCDVVRAPHHHVATVNFHVSEPGVHVDLDRVPVVADGDLVVFLLPLGGRTGWVGGVGLLGLLRRRRERRVARRAEREKGDEHREGEDPAERAGFLLHPSFPSDFWRRWTTA